jgi:phenylalanyl-tRNA synthetase beta chain
MKVSYNWLQEYLDFELPPIGELVDKIGAQLGAVEEVIELGPKYKGIVIAKVVSCQKHPDADKLSLCLVDDGGAVKDAERNTEGLVQVVCGAPNVREGLMVAWLPPGATVPASFDDQEPFTLEAREIRGQVSNGMLASAKELAISDDHSGIMELDVTVSAEPIKKGEIPHEEALNNYIETPSIKPGDNFAEVYKLNDYVIDVENKMFTHRPDCFGILGVAREIAGILGKPFVSPTFYRRPKTVTAQDGSSLEIRNELPEMVPRFVAQVFDNVSVNPSPVWMQTYLMRSGVRPINNIVDITNYYMLLTGQPTHAYDYDKVKALSSGDKPVIVVRNPKPGEKLKLLNGKEIEPGPEAIMIATDRQLIGVGGIMGGTETEVDSQTSKIILECANFDMYSVRRTGMEHGLFTDALTRFNKGQSPLQNDRVVAWMKDQIICDAGSTPGEVVDFNHIPPDILERDSLFPDITVSQDFINSRLGLELSTKDIARLLENVEFKVEAESDDLTVRAPFWRTDIELREDVVEEVGRLYGFDHLPLELPERVITPTKRDELLDFKDRIREILSEAGANELLTYSFVHGELIDKVGQDREQAFRLSNALSPDLQYYRLSLAPSLLEKVHANIKAGYGRFALFELGKAHLIEHEDEEGVPVEFDRVAMVFAADSKAQADYSGAAYYQARQYLTALLDKLGISDNVTFKPLDEGDKDQAAVYYQPGRAADVYVGETLIGRMGEYKPAVKKALKLPDFCAGFELGLEPLMQAEPAEGYVPLPRFPRVTQDISLSVPAELAYADLFNFMEAELKKVYPDNVMAELGPMDIYMEEGGKRKHITLRLTITSYERTLTDQEVNLLLDQAAAAAKSEYQAERL